MHETIKNDFKAKFSIISEKGVFYKNREISIPSGCDITCVTCYSTEPLNCASCTEEHTLNSEKKCFNKKNAEENEEDFFSELGITYTRIISFLLVFLGIMAIVAYTTYI